MNQQVIVSQQQNWTSINGTGMMQYQVHNQTYPNGPQKQQPTQMVPNNQQYMQRMYHKSMIFQSLFIPIYLYFKPANHMIHLLNQFLMFTLQTKSKDHKIIKITDRIKREKVRPRYLFIKNNITTR